MLIFCLFLSLSVPYVVPYGQSVGTNEDFQPDFRSHNLKGKPYDYKEPLVKSTQNDSQIPTAAAKQEGVVKNPSETENISDNKVLDDSKAELSANVTDNNNADSSVANSNISVANSGVANTNVSDSNVAEQNVSVHFDVDSTNSNVADSNVTSSVADSNVTSNVAVSNVTSNVANSNGTDKNVTNNRNTTSNSTMIMKDNNRTVDKNVSAANTTTYGLKPSLGKRNFTLEYQYDQRLNSKPVSVCCNADIINIFYNADLESRHMCYKKLKIQSKPEDEQIESKACIAECIAKQKRYVTKSGKIFVSELANNLKVAFKDLPWVDALLPNVVNACVERYHTFQDTVMGCNTRLLEIGQCIGRKLQFECNEYHLENDEDCLQDLYDAKYYKCIPASPGFGCDTIR